MPRAAARARTQVSRGLLPDTGSEYEGEGGRIGDALEFLLLNFTEMNKLWVRMQHQGSPKDRRAPARARRRRPLMPPSSLFCHKKSLCLAG
jgi:hypothetical protein